MQFNVIEKNGDSVSFLSADLQHLLTSLGTTQNMEQNSFLFRQGMVAEKLYLIKSGAVQLNVIAPDGKGITLRLCKSGDLFGEVPLYVNNPTYAFNAKVIEAGEVVCVDIERLHEELNNNHILATELIKWTSNELYKNQLKIKDLLLNGKRGALYSTLIRLTNSYGLKREDGILIRIVFKGQEIAELCGATREYTNRMLSELRDQNILSMEPTGNILVKDLASLKRLNNCGDCCLDVCNIN